MTKKKEISSPDEWQDVPRDESPGYFSTYDLGVSTALLCLGFELLSVTKDNPKKALFIFERQEGVEDITNQYFSDKLTVKARSYFDHLKALKNKLYSR